MTLLFILLPLAAYLLGSISFAWIAGHCKGIDLRAHGSGNLGATNAGRVLGGGWFAAVFCADVGKGVLPVLLARSLPATFGVEGNVTEHQILQIAAGAGAILGHVFTLFHRFRGGKAVATSLGVLVGLMPALAGLCALTWGLAWAVGACLLHASRSAAVGPASVAAALAAPAWWWLLIADPLAEGARLRTAFLVLLSVLVMVRHRSNIARLCARRTAGSAKP